MHTANHALWGATIGRLVGMPLEGAAIGALPDLVGIPALAWYCWRTKRPPETAPTKVLGLYRAAHNWWVGTAVALMLHVVSPTLGILGLAYCWHIFEDAFLHTTMAVPFLWPAWAGRVQAYSAAEHKWVQVAELTSILFVNLLISSLHK